jgi:4-hydroxy-2-oxoheptanedioate aldolase
MKMRPSNVLRKLRAGQIVHTFKLNLDSARTCELAASTGFDCIWTDMEHTATDLSLLEKQIWAAKCHDTDVVVRVARGSYSDYIYPLELDAAGIMVPHIMSLEDARQVVTMTRFQPLGRRALDGGNADGTYCNIALANYLEQANSQRFVVVQIEDPEPLNDLEAIASLEGIDIIFFGPGDFSNCIGAPGDFNHPFVLETRRRIADVCAKYGKFAGTVGSPDNFQELVSLGYRFINLGSDVVGLNNYCRNLLGTFERTISGEPTSPSAPPSSSGYPRRNRA